MLTRGHIIGKIIDELSGLESKINLRAQLGLTDLNKFTEDFIKEVLNISFNWNLTNLNDTRSNEPGLDLGDEKNRLAFQVTSVATSQKINNTLQKITDDQLARYDDIRVLIVGTKQKTYDAINDDAAARCHFDLDHIMDLSDICRQIISVSFDQLYALNSLFDKELQKVMLEFELPNKEGDYPTSILAKLEVAPNTIAVNAQKYLNAYPESSLENVHEAFKNLAGLPRVTREFLVGLIMLGENDDGNFRLSYHELTRKLHIPKIQIDEELSILENRRFIYGIDEEDGSITTRFDIILVELIDFAIENDFLKKFLVALDFTLIDANNAA